jgi:proline dehydrogenase
MNFLDRAISFMLPAVPKPLVGFFSRHYIAGDNVEQAVAVARKLQQQGAMATLDILGEFVSTTDEAQANAADYETLIDRIHDETLEGTNVSVKLSALGLLFDPELCLRSTRKLLQRIDATDNFLRIDMEDATCTDATLSIYRTLREEMPDRVGIVLQSRLRRTLDDVDELTSRAANIRLCKGIYLEPRSIAHTDAEIIRLNFVAALEAMFKRGAYAAIATHDERLTWEALRLIRNYNVPVERYEFQMLLGVEEALRDILIAGGHRMRVYIPFGKNWYAYSVRRLRENPQLAGHGFRAIFKR